MGGPKNIKLERFYCTSPTNHITGRMTRFMEKYNNSESIAKIEYKYAWVVCSRKTFTHLSTQTSKENPRVSRDVVRNVSKDIYRMNYMFQDIGL